MKQFTNVKSPLVYKCRRALFLEYLESPQIGHLTQISPGVSYLTLEPTANLKYLISTGYDSLILSFTTGYMGNPDPNEEPKVVREPDMINNNDNVNNERNVENIKN